MRLLPLTAFILALSLVIWAVKQIFQENNVSVAGIYRKFIKVDRKFTVKFSYNSDRSLKIQPWQLEETTRKYGEITVERINGDLNYTIACIADCKYGSKPGFNITVTAKCNNSWPYVLIPDSETLPRGSESTLPCFLERKSSKIEAADQGIFASIDLPSGVVFGPYKGIRIYSHNEANESGYAWLVPRSNASSEADFFYIDARDEINGNWLRYVNSARNLEEQNIYAFPFEEEIYYLVRKFIPAGNELLTWYGNNFADRLKLKLSEEAPNVPGLAPPKAYVICTKCNLQNPAVVNVMLPQ